MYIAYQSTPFRVERVSPSLWVKQSLSIVYCSDCQSDRNKMPELTDEFANLLSNIL